MRNFARTTMVVIAALAAGGVAIADDKHALPPSANGDLVVGLCDGTTSTQVKGVKPGQTLTPTQARQVADDLMNQWKKKNPAVGSSWDKETRVAQNTAPTPPQTTPPPAPATTATNVPTTPGSKVVVSGIGTVRSSRRPSPHATSIEQKTSTQANRAALKALLIVQLLSSPHAFA